MYISLALLPAGQTAQPPLGEAESPELLPHGLVTPSDGDSSMSWVTCPSTEPQGPVEVGVVGSIPGRTHMHWLLSRIFASLMDWGEQGVTQGTDPTSSVLGGSICGFVLQGTAFGKEKRRQASLEMVAAMMLAQPHVSP